MPKLPISGVVLAMAKSVVGDSPNNSSNDSLAAISISASNSATWAESVAALTRMALPEQGHLGRPLLE